MRGCRTRGLGEARSPLRRRVGEDIAALAVCFQDVIDRLIGWRTAPEDKRAGVRIPLCGS